MPDEPLKVIKLRVSNVMRLRAVEIEPNGAPVVTVTGRNAQGKTSLLKSIALALGGKRGAVEQALRDGEKKGEIFLDLGPYQVRRSFTQKGTYLTVTADGDEIEGGPQEFLDKLTGLFFQPFDFIRAPPRAANRPKSCGASPGSTSPISIGSAPGFTTSAVTPTGTRSGSGRTPSRCPSTATPPTRPSTWASSSPSLTPCATTTPAMLI